MSASSAPTTAEECLEALRTGLLRARFVLGCRWSGPDAAPSVSGPERYDLGLLFDALHNVPAYLRGLGAEQPDPVFAGVVRQGLNEFQAVYARLGRGIYEPPTSPPMSFVASASAPKDLLDDDGPFGPPHET